MKRFLYLIILLSAFFVSIGNVDAGICGGKDKGTYCHSSNSNSLASNVSFELLTGKIQSGGTDIYFLPNGFNVNTKLKSGEEQSSAAFCIDPGLLSPNSFYTYNRELNLSNEFDKKVYAMYQMLIKNYNSKVDRAIFEAILRIWTIRYSYSYVADDVNYKYDLARFLKCSDEIDEYILCDSGETNCSTDYTNYFNDRKKEISLDTNCFGSYKNKLANIYNTNTIIWDDVFEKSNTIKTNKIDTQNGSDYEITFTINFDNFFMNSDGISELNLNQASFNSTILFNGVDCSQTNCNANSISNNYNSDIKISNLTNANEQLIYTIKLSPEQYQEVYNNGGKITLKYDYNHPMNLDNIYFSRYSNNSVNPVYQRMLVIYNHNEEREVEFKLEEPNNMCAHNAIDNFIDKIGNKVNFGTYLSTCGCNKINEDYLDTSELNVYNDECIGEAKVTGNLHSCNLDSKITNGNKIEYQYEDERINNYCKMNCTETIQFINLPGKYSNIKAGGYLKIDYPTTLATKYCEVDVDYKSWEDAYNDALKSVISAYNTYAEEKAKKSANYASPCVDTDYRCSWKVEDCDVDDNNIETCNEVTRSDTFDDEPTDDKYSCTSFCADRDYDYRDASYIYVDSQDFTNSNKVVIESGRYDSMQHKSNISVEENNYKNALSVLQNLLSSLKTCTTKLKNTSYDYKEDLELYYEQTLNNGNVVYNNDYELKENNNTYSIGNYNLGNQKYYSFGNNINGIITENVPMFDYYQDYYTIHRTFEIENNYYIEDRYTKSFVGGYGTLSEYSNKNNLINLGPVYNIDENTIQKSDNKYYFVFNELGDDNQIYDYYNSRGEIRDSEGINRSSSVEDLKRYCNYGTINDLLCIPGTNDSDCADSGTNSLGSKILFKIVDPNNIDPNDRITKNDKGFENWKDKTSVIEDIESSDTFNPENLEYSFELDGVTIKSIREYNEVNDYLNYVQYDCDEHGNYCLSGFIDSATNGGYINGYKFNQSFATIVNGRENWKNYDIETQKIVIKDVS